MDHSVPQRVDPVPSVSAIPRAHLLALPSRALDVFGLKSAIFKEETKFSGLLLKDFRLGREKIRFAFQIGPSQELGGW